MRAWLRDRGLFDFRRARVVSCDASNIGEEDSASPFDIREASPEDLRALATAHGTALPPWLDRRSRGGVCLLARSGPNVLGYLWITRSPEWMTEVSHVIDVSRDPVGVYLFDGYVLPAHRRRGVLRALLAAATQWGRHRGLSHLYAAFAQDNHASAQALRKAGFVTLVGDVGLVRVLHRERKWVRVPRGRPTDVLNATGPSRLAPLAA